MDTETRLMLDEMTASRLCYFAEALNLDRNWIVKEALSRYFDYLEIQVVKQRLAALEQSGVLLADAGEVWWTVGNK